MAIGLKRGFVKSDNTGFNYSARGEVAPGESIIVRLPVVTANRRGVNDIGWQIDGDARLYATLSDHPENAGAMWQEILDYEDINKCAAAVKVVGGEETSSVYLRVILN